MERTTGGSEPSPARDRDAPLREPGVPADDVWFELHGRDGTLVGTESHVVHFRHDRFGADTVHEWRYGEIRRFHVTDGVDGSSIVIEPLHGPLVAIPISADSREEAYQAATVLGLLIARAQKAGVAGIRR